MGNIHSIPDTHVRIFKNLYAIQSPETRIQMIETLLASSDHVESMKLGGIYGQLLHYVQQIKSGKSALLPGKKPLLQHHRQQHQQHHQHQFIQQIRQQPLQEGDKYLQRLVLKLETNEL